RERPAPEEAPGPEHAAEEPAGPAAEGHRQCEEAGAKGAHRRGGGEVALEEERAPALEATLDDERDQGDDAEDGERAAEAQAGLARRAARPGPAVREADCHDRRGEDRKSTRLNSSH